MMGPWASVCFALVTMAATADTEVSSLSHNQLTAGRKFDVETADRLFRVQMVEPNSGECQMAISSDGESFTAPRTVYLLGATGGRQGNQMLVLMREVKVGMKMELSLGDREQRHRHITSEVTAIRLAE